MWNTKKNLVVGRCIAIKHGGHRILWGKGQNERMGEQRSQAHRVTGENLI